MMSTGPQKLTFFIGTVTIAPVDSAERLRVIIQA